MRIRLSLELKIERHQEPDQPEPSGTESMIIHHDQPRYIGFAREDQTDRKSN